MSPRASYLREMRSRLFWNALEAVSGWFAVAVAVDALALYLIGGR